jgi:hypothetical protein
MHKPTRHTSRTRNFTLIELLEADRSPADAEEQPQG